MDTGPTSICIRCAMRLLSAHYAYCRQGCGGNERCDWARELRTRVVAAREGA